MARPAQDDATTSPCLIRFSRTLPSILSLRKVSLSKSQIYVQARLGVELRRTNQTRQSRFQACSVTHTLYSYLLGPAIFSILTWHFLVQRYHRTSSLAISHFMDILYVPVPTFLPFTMVNVNYIHRILVFGISHIMLFLV
jgi:membrane-associated HD superfamily phosphohydrolase